MYLGISPQTKKEVDHMPGLLSNRYDWLRENSDVFLQLSRIDDKVRQLLRLKLLLAESSRWSDKLVRGRY